MMVAVAWGGCNCGDVPDFPDARTVRWSPSTESFGQWMSLDVAPDGQTLTMAYYNAAESGLAYALGTPSDDGTVSWIHEQVDGFADEQGVDTGDVGTHAAQRTFSDGSVWVAYRDETNAALVGVRRIGPATWTEPEVIDADGDAGLWNSVVESASGEPVVAYVDRSTQSLRLAQRVDGLWLPRLVGQGIGDMSHAQLSIAGGREVVAVVDSGVVRVFENDGGAFSETQFSELGHEADWPHLAVIGGDIVVSYQRLDNPGLWLARQSAARPVFELVAQGEHVGADSRVFEHDGGLAVLYADGLNNDAWVALEREDEWAAERWAGEDAAVGFHNGTASAAGMRWMATYDAANDDVWIAPLPSTL